MLVAWQSVVVHCFFLYLSLEERGTEHWTRTGEKETHLLPTATELNRQQ
jgi:hypothetical protein